jgi:membrane protein
MESITASGERALDEDRGPDSPTDVSQRSWWQALKRTVAEFRDDNLTDWAAALTYYGVLAIFPALIALVSILGLVGDSATQPLIENLEQVAPGPASEILTNAINSITASRESAGIALAIGIAGAVFSASGYVGAFGRASNAIYEVEEGRPFYKLRPLQMGITFLLLVFVAISVVAIVVSGPLAEEVGKLIGVEGTAVTVWNIAKWPVIALVVLTAFAILYYGTPNIRQAGFRWITPGSVLALALWIAASALFAFYVANFGAYNATYGALAGVIIFLVWLWITNVAILLGAELNAELERSRELEAGIPEHETIALPPRDPAKEG